MTRLTTRRSTGLPALRHLQLFYCELTDTAMDHLVDRLPDPESACLMDRGELTAGGLVDLGRLPALKLLLLRSFFSISEQTLTCSSRFLFSE